MKVLQVSWKGCAVHLQIAVIAMIIKFVTMKRLYYQGYLLENEAKNSGSLNKKPFKPITRIVFSEFEKLCLKDRVKVG